MASKLIRFTKRTIESLEVPESGRDIYRDKDTKYLQLFVSAAGGRVFYYVRKIRGRVRYLKIGTFPETTVFLARKQASLYSGEVAQGFAPGEEAKKLGNSTTFGFIFDSYLTEHMKVHGRTWKEDKRMCDVYFPFLKSRRAADISNDEIRKLHRKLGSDRGKHQANRCLQLIRRVYNYSIKNGGAKFENPASGIRLFKERPRERFLSSDELVSFLAALDKVASPDLQDFFRLLLYTGARRANLQAMAWADLDLSDASWTIPGETFKNGDQMRVVLCQEAVDILAKRKLLWDGQTQYVFSSKRSDSKHIVEPKATWKKILAKAKISNLRMHDLRRTLGSWQAAQGSSLQVIGKSLGHKDYQTTQIYARLNMDPIRESVGRAVSAMLNAEKSSSDEKKTDES